jgi:transglutaminase-like putative cysteine protease
VPFVSVDLDIEVNDSGSSEQVGKPPKRLTAATSFWPSNAARMLALAQQIFGDSTTHDAKVTAILQWLTPGRNLEYSGETGSRWGTRQVFEQGFGHCWDFSDCFVTLARAAGVPCRQIAGWLYGSGGHVWAEYVSDANVWQQVDPTGGGQLTCGIYYIPWFTSKDGEMPIVYVSKPEVELLQTTRTE